MEYPLKDGVPEYVEGILKALESQRDLNDAWTRLFEAYRDEVEKLWSDRAELRDELHAVSNRLEALTRGFTTHPADVASKMAALHAVDVVPFKCPHPDCPVRDPHEHHADGHMIFRGAAS